MMSSRDIRGSGLCDRSAVKGFGSDRGARAPVLNAQPPASEVGLLRGAWLPRALAKRVG